MFYKFYTSQNIYSTPEVTYMVALLNSIEEGGRKIRIIDCSNNNIVNISGRKRMKILKMAENLHGNYLM